MPRGLLVAAFGLLVGACFSDASPMGTPGSTGSDCAPGSEGCLCSAGECLGSLVCDPGSDRCFPGSCTPGVFECPCREDQTCDPALRCVAGSCMLEETGSSTAAEVTSGTVTTSSAATTDDVVTDATTSSSTGSGGTTSSEVVFPDDAVIMFYGGQLADGNIAAPALGATAAALRAYVNETCERQPVAATLPCATTRGLISVGVGETISTIASAAASGPLVGPSGIPIAESLSAALEGDTTLSNSLAAAGVVDLRVVGDQWWSGSLLDGDIDPSFTCAGWTSNAAGTTGSAGSTDTEGSGWVSSEKLSCSSPAPLLCVCWSAP